MFGTGAFTPQFLMDLESRMRVTTATGYENLIKNLWWTKIAKEMPSKSARELLTFFLETATIEYTEEGNMGFEELLSRQVTYQAEYAAKGLKVLKSKFEDLDGNGVNAAIEWSKQVGQYAAYFPQKHIANLMKAGTGTTLGKAYDGLSFFHASHPVSVLDGSSATFSNLLTGQNLNGTLDQRVTSLKAIKTAIANVKCPNGQDPRNLVMGTFFAPPAMVTHLVEVLDAKFLALNSGSSDTTGLLSALGFRGVVECQELGAAFGGSDTDVYLMTEPLGGTPEIDAFVWVNREPFNIQYYSGQDGGQMSADLNRTRELEWHIQGRNVAAYGHPYRCFKITT